MTISKNQKWLIVAAALVILIAAVIVVVWRRNMNLLTGPGEGVSPSLSTSGPSAVAFDRTAYSIALKRATTWKSDATLLSMSSSGSTGQMWNFTFVSQTAKGKGFVVVMDGQTVVSADEIALAGNGATLPENIIVPDRAISLAHAVPGYASLGVESM